MSQATKAYLLDNNVISVAVRPAEPRHAIVINHIRAAGSNFIVLPTMAIAEIHEGMARVDATGVQLPPSAIVQRADLRKFLFDYPKRQDFGKDAIEPYSLIRSKLWIDHGTKTGRKWRLLPEELTEKTTGKSLGIDERDLLIASIAAAYGMELATLDFNPGMASIGAAAKALEAAGQPVKLRIADWRK